MKRISVDIGGTFTDCFVAWEDQYVEAKALTTHHNLAQGFNEALDLACSRAGLDRDLVLKEVDSVRYATTLGTNALIEAQRPARRGAGHPRLRGHHPAVPRPRLRRRTGPFESSRTCPMPRALTRWCPAP